MQTYSDRKFIYGVPICSHTSYSSTCYYTSILLVMLIIDGLLAIGNMGVQLL